MARTKAALGTGARLADYLSASLLARVVPAGVANDVLNAHGRNSQRVRRFPAVVGVYYCIALSLYPEATYEEVFAAVSQGLCPDLIISYTRIGGNHLGSNSDENETKSL